MASRTQLLYTVSPFFPLTNISHAQSPIKYVQYRGYSMAIEGNIATERQSTSAV